MEQAELQLPISAPRTSDNTDTDQASDNAEMPMTRDFAYPNKHALFHCALQKDDELRRNSIEEEHGWEDGPPWPEDDEEDLTFDALQQDEGSGIETTKDDVQGRAVALFDFAPEHENEFALTEGQILFVSSRHGLGWLVAVDPDSGDCGLVPEEYIQFLDAELEGEPEGLDSEWVDEPEHHHKAQSYAERPTKEQNLHLSTTS